MTRLVVIRLARNLPDGGAAFRRRAITRGAACGKAAYKHFPPNALQSQCHCRYCLVWRSGAGERNSRGRRGRSPLASGVLYLGRDDDCFTGGGTARERNHQCPNRGLHERRSALQCSSLCHQGQHPGFYQRPGSRPFRVNTGTNVGLEQIALAASEVLSEFQKRGYRTANVSIALGQITNGLVTMNVFQGGFPQIFISGEPFIRPGGNEFCPGAFDGRDERRRDERDDECRGSKV